ncbi:MAG: hypothetical protein ACM3UP_01645 [Methanocella sp.]
MSRTLSHVLSLLLVGALLLAGAAPAVLANAAHHQSPGAAPPAGAQTPPPAPPVQSPPPPPPAASPGAAPQIPTAPGEVAVTDLTDLGVSLEKDQRQPSLYDLMMRIMNLMQPHMKEMMGGVPAPDPSVSPNLVLDLDSPSGVKSTSKATPETGGSGSLILTPAGPVDPVSANMGMGGMTGQPAAAGSPPSPQAPEEQLRLLKEQLAALQRQIEALSATLAGQKVAPAPASAPAPVAAPVPVPPPAPPPPAPGEVRVEL